MKLNKNLFAMAAVLSGVLSFSVPASAADHSAKVTPYPLKTCLITGEKLGGDMGDPYVITNGTHEIKFCCKGCVKDFNKDKAKYLKKLENPDKKAK